MQNLSVLSLNEQYRIEAQGCGSNLSNVPTQRAFSCQKRKRILRLSLKRFATVIMSFRFCKKSLYVQMSIFMIPSKAEMCVNILNTTYSKCMP